MTDNSFPASLSSSQASRRTPEADAPSSSSDFLQPSHCGIEFHLDNIKEEFAHLERERLQEVGRFSQILAGALRREQDLQREVETLRADALRREAALKADALRRENSLKRRCARLVQERDDNELRLARLAAHLHPQTVKDNAHLERDKALLEEENRSLKDQNEQLRRSMCVLHRSDTADGEAGFI